jgi:hypothetical protein
MATITNHPIITITNTGSTVSPSSTVTVSYQERSPFTGNFLLLAGSEQSLQAYQAGVQVTLPISSVFNTASGEEAYLRLVVTGSPCTGHIEDFLYAVYFQGSPIPCTDVTLAYSGALDIPNDDFDVQRQTIIDSLCSGGGSSSTYYININGPITSASVLLAENITISDGPGCSAAASAGWYALSLSGFDCIGGYWDPGLAQFKYARPCSSCLGLAP